MRKVVIVITAIIFCFLMNPLFLYSQESKTAQVLIDTAVKYKSSAQIKKALEKYQNTKEYAYVEEYAKTWIRKLIITEDYDFATEVVFVLIESNIDADYEDDEALDLYSEITTIFNEMR